MFPDHIIENIFGYVDSLSCISKIVQLNKKWNKNGEKMFLFLKENNWMISHLCLILQSDWLNVKWIKENLSMFSYYFSYIIINYLIYIIIDCIFLVVFVIHYCLILEFVPVSQLSIPSVNISWTFLDLFGNLYHVQRSGELLKNSIIY
jgi:hypothetical protein